MIEISREISRETARFRAKMTFSYGKSKRPEIKALSTFQAIKNGERTATTRYESDGHIDYWKKAKTNDIIEFTSAQGETLLARVTRPLHKLQGSGKTPEIWSKLEGWSLEYFYLPSPTKTPASLANRISIHPTKTRKIETSKPPP
jgi:hypothetical protein